MYLMPSSLVGRVPIISQVIFSNGSVVLMVPPQWCNKLRVGRVASLTLLTFSDVCLDVLFVTRPIEPLFDLTGSFLYSQMSSMSMELFLHSLLQV